MVMGNCRSAPSHPLDVSGDGRISGNVGIGIAPDQSFFNQLKVYGSIKVHDNIDLPLEADYFLKKIWW